MDKLIGGVFGESPDEEKKSENPVNNTDEEKIHGGGALDKASHNRAAAKEHVVDELLTEFAANPHAKIKVKKKKVKRYPCYDCRKVIGCAHVDLHTAVLEGNLSTLRSTLRRLGKKDPDKINEYDEKGRSPLSLAVKEAREDIADLILSSSDSDPDTRDKWTGMAPMHHAAHLGLLVTVSKLLWRQADINILDNNGTTPLMMACANGNFKMVDLLLEEVRLENHNIPLHKCADLISLLTLFTPCLQNADPEKRDNYHWNALFYAAYGGSLEVTQRILNEGVNKRLRDKKKLMAIDWAEYMKHGEIAALLETFKIEMSTDKYRSTFG